MKQGIFVNVTTDYKLELTHKPNGIQVEFDLSKQETNKLFWQIFEDYGLDEIKKMLFEEGFILKKAEDE